MKERKQHSIQGLPTIPYTELTQIPSGNPIAAEWNTYLWEVGRLLAEGHEGKWVLIEGEEIIGIWNTEAEADGIRVQKCPRQPVLVKQICAREPVIRGGGYQLPWRS